MRKKLPKEEKKKSINLTINPYLNEILDKHIEKIGINKSKFIEQLLEEKFKNNK